MLKEIKVAQKEEGVFRRWFEDKYFELIAWYDREGGKITGFQLCYDRYGDEHSLTWFKDNGFQHNRIDSDRNLHKHPSTPILVEDGIFPAEKILIKFLDSCHTIDLDISSFVIGKLLETVEKSSSKIKLRELLSNIIAKLMTDINRLTTERDDIKKHLSKPIEDERSFPHSEIDIIDDKSNKTNKEDKDLKKIDRRPSLTNKIKSFFNRLLDKDEPYYGIKTKSEDSLLRKEKIDGLMKNAELLSKKINRKKLK